MLEFGNWTFLGGESLLKWINRWRIEIEYCGVQYVYKPPSAIQDFDDAVGIRDVRFSAMTKEQEVKYMLKYIEARVDKFTDGNGGRLVDNLEEKDLEIPEFF